MSLPAQAAADDFDPTAALQLRAVTAGAAPAGDVNRMMDEALGFFPVETARAGVADATAPLPHLDTIQASFGHHDVRGVRAGVGGGAGDAARALGAEAYATGDAVGFHAAPDLHTAAHEAAHVVQQRQGVALKGGVGAAGDVYEQHADRVADAVVRGESAEALLDEHAGRGGAAGEGAVQRLELSGGKDLGNDRGAGAGVNISDGGVTAKGEYEIAPSFKAIPIVPGVELKPAFSTTISIEGGVKDAAGSAPAAGVGKIQVQMTGALQVHAGKDAAFSVFGEGAVQVALAASGEYSGGRLTIAPLTAELASQMSVGIQAAGYSAKVPVDTYQLLVAHAPSFTIENGRVKSDGDWDFALGKDASRFGFDVLIYVAGGPLWFGVKKAWDWAERSWGDLSGLWNDEHVGETAQRAAAFIEFWSKHSAKYRELMANPMTKQYMTEATLDDIRGRWHEAMMSGSITGPVLAIQAKQREEVHLRRMRDQVSLDLVGQGYSQKQIDTMIAQLGRSP